jgi:uncharacterized delta-60 repeat protein
LPSRGSAGRQIILAGFSRIGATANDFALARLNYDGTLDSTFDGDGKQTVDFGSYVDSLFAVDDECYAIAVQGDKVVLAGFRRSPSAFAMARLNGDGTLDSTFDGDGKQTISFGSSTSAFCFDVALQNDQIVAAGYSYSDSTNGDFAVIRLNDDGSLDTSFGGDGTQNIDLGPFDIASSVAVQNDKIIIDGVTSEEVFGFGFTVARLNGDGSLDTTFDGDGQQTIDFGPNEELAVSVAVQADGKIVAAGNTNQDGGYDLALARLNVDGSLDTAFDGDGKVITNFGGTFGENTSVAVQSDGSIIVAGNSQGAAYDFILARYLGNQAPTASPGGPYTVAEGRSITLNGSASTDPDGAIVAYQWDFNYDGITFDVNASGIFPTFSASTLNGPAAVTIALRVTDNSGATHIRPSSVTITNAAPTAGVSGPAVGVTAQPLTYQFTAADVPADLAAGFTYQIDWNGDESDVTTIHPSANNHTINVSHAYAQTGRYQINVLAMDRNGAISSVRTHGVDISSVVQTGSDTYIGGTGDADIFDFQRSGGAVFVRRNSDAAISVSPTGRILVFGGPGTDSFSVRAARLVG